MSRTLLSRLARVEASRAVAMKPLVIVGADQAECNERLKQADTDRQAIGRKPVLILTGVPRSGRDTECQ